MNFELFIVLKRSQKPVADEFSPSDCLNNLYKSLEKKLTFNLFSKYCCIFYEPVFKNELYINLDLKGLLLQATSIHEWSKFIPEASPTPKRADLLLKTDNTFNIVLSLNDIGIDYTPCVTNKSCLEIYKNYNYKIDSFSEDSSDDEETMKRNRMYKTNTRIVTLLGKTNLELKGNDQNLAIQLKFEDLASYLLWTRDYSPKWSSELLLDEEKMINSIHNDLLTQMGFVNILRINNIDVNVNKELQKTCPKTLKPLKALKSVASLPDIQDTEDLELPIIMLNSCVPPPGGLEINVNINSFLVYCCHDSILGCMLLQQAATSHISKSLKKVARKMAKSPKKSKEQNIFTSIIKEEYMSSDSEEEKKGGVDLSSYLETEKFSQNAAEPRMKKDLSDIQKSIIQDFDIIDDRGKDKNKLNFREGEVKVTDKLEFIEDYMDDTAIEKEASSRWHSIITPKSDLSSNIHSDKVIVPSVKFSLTLKSVEIRVYEGQDFCFQSSQGLQKQVKESIVMGFEQRQTLQSFRHNREENKDDPQENTLLEFGEIQEFLEQEEAKNQGLDIPGKNKIDESKGRVRTKKRNSKRYFQFLINYVELSFFDLKESHDSIESQVGFTIEKIHLNEVRSRTDVMKIFYFDNDLDSHKNIGMKVIFLKNNEAKHEKAMEIYTKLESVKINISHISITFAYLLVQPLTLFVKNEMRKDEQLIEEVKKKSKQPDPYESITMKRVDSKIEGLNDSSIWKVSDKNVKKKSVIYIKYLHMQPFYVKLSYTSNNLNIVNLYKGDLLNYITNLVDFSNMKIKFKEFKIKDKILIEKAISNVVEFYLNDLIYNQKLNLLASVYPIRVTLNIMKAFVVLLKSPVNSYINERYVIVGVYQGFTEFISKITHEFEDVGAKLMTYISSWKNFIQE